MRIRTIIVFLGLLAFASLPIVAYRAPETLGPLLLTHEAIDWVDDHRGRIVGWKSFWRWGDQREYTFQTWYVDSGFRETWSWRGRQRETSWRVDGTLSMQSHGVYDRMSPPWKWGQSDETEPSAPWVRAGETVEEWLTRFSPAAP